MRSHGPLNVEGFVDPMFQENGYLVWPQASTDAWVIDPSFDPQPKQINAAIEQHGLTPVAILLTHCHVDHLSGVNALRERFAEVPIWAPQDEQHMLTDPSENLSAQMGMAVTAPQADRLLAPGDELELGDTRWQVLDVRGHSPGGRAYYCATAGVVFTGDALFAGSIGRTDFPGGSAKRLLANIRQHLFSLPDDTVAYSGHGPPTTIRRERDTNPFFQEGIPR